MILTMRSEDLPAADRFEWWREQVARDTAPTVPSSPHAADFRAVVTLAELGPVHLSVLEFPEVRGVRPPALVRRSDPERYGLSLVAANELWFAQRRRECRVSEGDLLLHDTSYAWDSRALPGTGPGRMVILNLPKAALPLRPQRLDGLLARRLPTGSGMAAILSGALTGIAAAVENGELGEPDAQRLGKVALDLAAAALAAEIGAQDQLGPETRRQALLSQVEAFIELNLGDPELDPALIAAHHHISLAYLHRLFQSRERTVAAWIRHRRLERCRADLADPRLGTRPVQAIAARWGFRHPADFSRAFHRSHGIPPGEYRRRALRPGADDRSGERRAPAGAGLGGTGHAVGG